MKIWIIYKLDGIESGNECSICGCDYCKKHPKK